MASGQPVPLPKPAIPKPRFKGIENLLRRIAFNLGNSPSQTEVKIISCIPIDVTDLQNKIVELERELDDRAQDEEQNFENEGQPEIRAAIGAPTYTPSPLFSNHNITAPTGPTSPSLNAEPPSSLSLSDVESKPIDTRTDKSSTGIITEDNRTKKKQKNILKIKRPNKKKGKTQLVYFAHTIYPQEMHKEKINRNKRREMNEDVFSKTYLNHMMHRQYQPQLTVLEPSSSSGFSWPVCRDEPASDRGVRPLCDSDACSCCHGLFHNVDHTARNNYSIYYDSSLYDVVPVKERPSRIMDSPTYPDRQNDSFINQEDYYFPKKRKMFQVQFQQPEYVTRYCAVATPRVNPKERNKNKLALKREQVLRSMQKRKYNHSTAEISCSGFVECGNVYTKPAQHITRLVLPPTPPSQPSTPAPSPMLKNAECLTSNLEEHTLTSRSVQLEPLPSPPSESNKTEITLNQIKSILHAVLTEVKIKGQIKPDPENKVTKDAMIQNGLSHSNFTTDSNYMNGYLYNPRFSIGPYGPSFSGQTAGKHSFYQTGSMSPPPGLYGQDTGTPSRALFNPTTPCPFAESMKCVQNYPLFIHTTGQPCACCYRSMPTRPKLPTDDILAPNTINTEVGKSEPRSNETNNLIKEIYKSLALNINYPPKDTPSKYHGNHTISASNKKIELKFEPKAKPNPIASETLQKNNAQPPLSISKGSRFCSTATSFRSEVETATTTRTTSGLDTVSAMPRGDGVHTLLPSKDKLLSTGSETAQESRQTPSTRSRKYSPPAHERSSHASSHDHSYAPADSRDRDYSPPSNYDRKYPPSKNRNRKYTVPVIPSSVSDEDTMTPSNEESEQSEATIIETEKKEKKGIFSKMKKIFTGRSRRRRKMNNETSSEVEQQPTSDSDDYETVYSERSTRMRGKRAKHHPPPSSPVPRRRRPHSKMSFSRYGQRREPIAPHSPRYRCQSPVMAPPRARRSPYMEQEYRRHWTEDMAFHQGDTSRFTTERPYMRSRRENNYGRHTSPPARYPYSPYWREYQAHYAYVPPPQPPYPPQPAYPPPNRLPPLQPPLAPHLQPNQAQYQMQNQMNNFRPTEPASNPTYLPQSYRPAPKGFGWLKSINTNCGVPWKKFFLEA